MQAFGEVTQVTSEWGSSPSTWTATGKFLQKYLIPHHSSVLTMTFHLLFHCIIYTHSCYYVSLSTLDCESLGHSHTSDTLKGFTGLNYPPLPWGCIYFSFSIKNPSSACFFRMFSCRWNSKTYTLYRFINCPCPDIKLVFFHGYTRKNKVINVLIIILEFYFLE